MPHTGSLLSSEYKLYIYTKHIEIIFSWNNHKHNYRIMAGRTDRQTVKMYISKNFLNQDIETSFIDNNAWPSPIHSTSLEMSEVSSAPYSRTISKMNMNDLFCSTLSRLIFIKKISYLLNGRLFLTQKIFNIFVKHEYGLKMPYW